MTPEEKYRVIEFRKNVVTSQLDIHYKQLEADRNRRYSTRNWFITIWVSVLVAIGSEKFKFDDHIRTFIIIVPIINFWVLEVLLEAFVKLNEERAMSLERKLLEDNFSQPLSIDSFLVSGHRVVSYQQKLKSFVQSMLCESILLFYLLAFICSMGLLQFLKMSLIA